MSDFIDLFQASMCALTDTPGSWLRRTAVALNSGL
jgi:hypothetical protein